jgi:branched-chain amino acid aminotransferase
MSGLVTAGQVGAMWLDGRHVPPDQASLPVLSLGLHNAVCVFEGIRAYDGKPFAAAAHVDRLCASSTMIGMSLPWSATQIAAAIDETVTAAGYSDAYIRPVAWRGDEVIGIDPTATTVHLAIAVLRWPEAVRRPVRLGLSQWARPGPNMAPVGAKTSATYLVGSIALAETKQHGFDDTVLLDHRGRLAEATGANIFVVRDGELATPVADTFLDGITRQTILELAGQAGIPTRVTRLAVDDVFAADEVFLTGTAVGVQPVGSFLDTEYRDDRPITQTLADAYARLVIAHREKETPRVSSA